jgi:hypothetical protein
VEDDMIPRPFRRYAAGVAVGLLLVAVTTPAWGQTPSPFPGGLEIRLLPGFSHERLKGEHGPTGKFTKKGGLEIHYVMGRIGRPDAPAATSGDFRNAALLVPEANRLWLKQQNVGGRQVHVAYTKDRIVIVSSVSTKEGVNFTAVTESPGDVAEVLLIVLTLTEPQTKRDK